jgi:hypothetical protein
MWQYFLPLLTILILFDFSIANGPSFNDLLKRLNQTKTSSSSPPNIIVFIVDDLGWNQVGYHAKPSGNNEIRTPHIDYHATQVGIELDRSYMTPWCGPSRAALMTGRTNVYNANVSSLISTFDDGIGYVAGLQPGTKTLATAFKEYGASIQKPYTAWFNGKWGIGVSTYWRFLLHVCTGLILLLSYFPSFQGNCIYQYSSWYGI